MAIFDSWGVRHPVTVLQLDECDVIQVRQARVISVGLVSIGGDFARP